MPPTQYVIIAGSIGVGKSTFARDLAQALGCPVLLEKKGRFVRKFYENPRFAFLNQLDYSIQYLEHAFEIASLNGTIIQDRSIYDTHQVFSELHRAAGRISPAEFQSLERLFLLASRVARPTLLVLLEASVDVAYSRMSRRGDEEEAPVTRAYLATLAEAYRCWFEKFDLCRKVRISTDQMDWRNVMEHVLHLLHLPV